MSLGTGNQVLTTLSPYGTSVFLYRGKTHRVFSHYGVDGGINLRFGSLREKRSEGHLRSEIVTAPLEILFKYALSRSPGSPIEVGRCL